MDKVAVLVPCYNEEQTIEKVIRDFRNVLPEARELLSGMSISREREMSCGECSARSMHSAT